MNVLLLGSGGREHALATTIAKSNLLTQLFIAPGNAGTAATGTNVSINIADFEAIKSFVINHNIELVVVGPEAPLADGITDFFAADSLLMNIKIIGPGKAGAALESSKDFAKSFMLRHAIPTAQYGTFTKATLQEAFNYLGTKKPPFVLKADGLAAGKGVIITSDIEEAKTALREMFEGKFGAAGNSVVIEDFLDGIELSVFVLTDGNEYILLPEAKDYKRIGEGDTGLNTGGMGSISPVPFADKAFMERVEKKIIQPTIQGLQQDNIPYCGFIFFGLINVDNEPYVIEYNVRMGDPETESVMPRIQSDFLALLHDAACGKLKKQPLIVDPRTAAAVMMVSGGYPEGYEKGKVITGLSATQECDVFHAGTTTKNEKIVTNGGRVLAVCALDNDLEAALKKAYHNVDKIAFERHYFRTDLGKDLL